MGAQVFTEGGLLRIQLRPLGYMKEMEVADVQA
jgi:hypothetical protein